MVTLVTAIDLTEATKVANHVRMDYDVYALFLKNGTNDTISGRLNTSIE
ncbi:MAG: hypothetical protein HDS66_05335 [Bacteroidales bacterium]|nr:hypothetical protein [Bacteroidales bacterium]